MRLLTRLSTAIATQNCLPAACAGPHAPPLSLSLFLSLSLSSVRQASFLPSFLHSLPPSLPTSFLLLLLSFLPSFLSAFLYTLSSSSSVPPPPLFLYRLACFCALLLSIKRHARILICARAVCAKEKYKSTIYLH